MIRHLTACMLKDGLLFRSAAADEFGEITRILPDGMMHLGHGLMLRKAGRFDEAERALRTAADAQALVPIRRRVLFELMAMQLNRLIEAGQPDEKLSASAAKYARELAQFAPLNQGETFMAVRSAIEGGDFPLALLLLADAAKGRSPSVPELGFRCQAEFGLGAFERSFRTAGQLLAKNADDEAKSMAYIRQESLSRMRGNVDPHFDWLAEMKWEIDQYAATIKLPGDDKDANAELWATEAVPGRTDVLDGAWQARVMVPELKGKWLPYTAKVSTEGERVIIELTHPGQTNAVRKMIVRRDGKRLLGWQANTSLAQDASPWVGLVVDGERIDGAVDAGRLDLRRKLMPPAE